jgi:hypothetical protein
MLGSKQHVPGPFGLLYSQQALPSQQCPGAAPQATCPAQEHGAASAMHDP